MRDYNQEESMKYWAMNLSEAGVWKETNGWGLPGVLTQFGTSIDLPVSLPNSSLCADLICSPQLNAVVGVAVGIAKSDLKNVKKLFENSDERWCRIGKGSMMKNSYDPKHWSWLCVVWRETEDLTLLEVQTTGVVWHYSYVEGRPRVTAMVLEDIDALEREANLRFVRP